MNIEKSIVNTTVVQTASIMCRVAASIVEMKIIRMMCYWIIVWNYSVLQEIS
ncbi:hypothetical protein [Mediterraneibacter gnavus]|uniref:hypothetical protein n=1 Tax=Mediterraneibacter gnavus TaxID=33038 RepID=UPI0036F1D7D6